MGVNNFEKNYSIKTVKRAVQILRAFSREKNQLTLTDFHSITGIGKSSLQRLLATLTAEGLLQKNEQDKKYQLGLDFIFIAELVERNSSLISIARPVMERLNLETTESISLSIIYNNERKCIHIIESKHELTALTHVGQTSPLYSGASAKILLANLSETDLEDYLNKVELETVTENTIIKRDNLIEELEKIRKQGFAFSNGERVKGAMSISTPIFNPFLKIFASLTIITPSVRMDNNNIEELIQKMIDSANEITKRLEV